jgi:hypothetical protein
LSTFCTFLNRVSCFLPGLAWTTIFLFISPLLLGWWMYPTIPSLLLKIGCH